MPPKKAAPLPTMLPTKASFFSPKRIMEEKRKDDSKSPAASIPQAPQKKRRFLYEEGTGQVYAEVIDSTAVCVSTGMELFRFRHRQVDPSMSSVSMSPFGGGRGGFDFTPPDGGRHPGERVVDVRRLVKAGILSDEDVARQRPFSDQELEAAMERLKRDDAEMEARFACPM